MVAVDGAGSTWTSTSDLTIGSGDFSMGRDTLLVSGGGAVSVAGLLFVEPYQDTRRQWHAHCDVVNRGEVRPGLNPGLSNWHISRQHSTWTVTTFNRPRKPVDPSWRNHATERLRSIASKWRRHFEWHIVSRPRQLFRARPPATCSISSIGPASAAHSRRSPASRARCRPEWERPNFNVQRTRSCLRSPATTTRTARRRRRLPDPAKTLGQTGVAPAADGNANHQIDPGDFDVCAPTSAKPPATGAQQASSSVTITPEPAAGLLA